MSLASGLCLTICWPQEGSTAGYSLFLLVCDPRTLDAWLPNPLEPLFLFFKHILYCKNVYSFTEV